MALEIDTDERFTRRERRLQHLGWALIGVVLVAAAAGFLGPGPVSHSTAVTPDGTVRVHYLRFARQGGMAGLRIEVDRPALEAGLVSIWATRDFFDRMQIDSITPQPVTVAVDGDELRFDFAAEPSGRFAATFGLTPTAMGAGEGSVRLADRGPVRFKQLVYP